MDDVVARYVSTTDADQSRRADLASGASIRIFQPNLNISASDPSRVLPSHVLRCFAHCLTGTTSRCEENDDAWCDLGLAELPNDPSLDGVLFGALLASTASAAPAATPTSYAIWRAASDRSSVRRWPAPTSRGLVFRPSSTSSPPSSRRPRPTRPSVTTLRSSSIAASPTAATP